MTLLWQRYFLKEICKVFCLFLGSFYFLFVLIDFSTHSKAFHHESTTFLQIALYYLYQFTEKADILIPFALLVASIKVLSTLALRNEIVALVTSGLSLKTLLKPFLLIALLCSGFLYFNAQFLTPQAEKALGSIESHLKGDQGEGAAQVAALPLADESVLIYGHFDPLKNAFHDAYWVRSQDDIYRIEVLYPYTNPPSGMHTDHLVRTASGQLQRKESFSEMTFSGMQFDGKSLKLAVSPPKWQSASELYKNIPWKRVLEKMNDREAETTTLFAYKMLLPLVCFLAILLPAPFLLRFGRHLQVFFIYALSLFALIAFFTLMRAAAILGESQVISPLIVISLPVLCIFLLAGWKYAKL